MSFPAPEKDIIAVHTSGLDFGVAILAVIGSMWIEPKSVTPQTPNRRTWPAGPARMNPVCKKQASIYENLRLRCDRRVNTAEVTCAYLIAWRRRVEIRIVSLLFLLHQSPT